MARQPFSGNALPTPTWGRVDKRRPKHSLLHISLQWETAPAGVSFFCGRKLTKKLKVACWNVRTLLDSAASNRPIRRTAVIASELARYDIDIAALSETRLADEGCLQEVGQGYTFYWKGLPADQRRIHGVGFAVKTSLLASIEDSPTIFSERLMTWRIPLARARYMTVFSVYAPTLPSADVEKDSFYSSLSHAIQRTPRSDKILVMGDFNARVGRDWQLWRGIIGRHGAGACNDNGLRLLTTCADHNLAITNTLFQLRNKHKATWMHPRSRHWHILDYVLVRQCDIADVQVTRVMRGAEASTDHRLVVSMLKLTIRRPVRKRAAQPRLCLYKLKDDETLNRYQTGISEKLTALTDVANDDDTPAKTWTRVSDIILNVGKEVLGVEARKHRDWFDENNTDIRMLLCEKNKAHNRFLACPTASNKAVFKDLQAEAQRNLRRMENEWWTVRAGGLQSYADTGDLHNFYAGVRAVCGPITRTLTPVKAANGEILSDKRTILQRWAEYFRTLLNDIHPTNPAFLNGIPQMPVMEDLASPPTLLEVEHAISCLKNHKAAGPDNVAPELLKYGGYDVVTTLHDLFTRCWEREEVPQVWKDAKIVTIYKRKGDRAVCSNSRGISLLSVGGKVLARILLQRLVERVVDKVVPESQCGFRRDRSTVDMVFTARLLQEKCREHDKDLFIAFIDLTKAFDTVDRQLLWSVLLRFGCPPKFVQLVRAFHDGMTASVVAAGDCSDTFGVIAGVKQGCVLAPILFNLFVSTVITAANANIDRKTDGVTLRYRYDGGIFNLRRFRPRTKTSEYSVVELQYADDAALVSHSEEGLQRILDAVSAAYNDAGMVINTTKTEVLVQRAGTTEPQRAPRLSASGADLSVVDRFTYLGSVLSDDCTLDIEVDRRIALATTAFGSLSKRVFCNRRLSVRTKILVYKAICISVLLYGCEAWALHRHQFRKLEFFHIKCLLRILGLHWRNMVPHVEIRHRCNISSLEETVRARQLRWAGHVSRQHDSRLPRVVMFSELATGMRSTGGQRKRFKDNLKASLKKFNIDPAAFERLSADRRAWRRAVISGAAYFGDCYRASAVARRERRHAPPPASTHICHQCGRGCASLAGLRSHQRSHARRQMDIDSTHHHPP